MLSVMFIKSETKELKPFQKLSIPEACEITETVETQYQRTKKKVDADFFILDEEDQEVYAGTLSIGSGRVLHIVDHIKKKLGINEDFYSIKHLNLDETATFLDIHDASAMASHNSSNITARYYAIGEKLRQNERLKQLQNKFA